MLLANSIIETYTPLQIALLIVLIPAFIGFVVWHRRLRGVEVGEWLGELRDECHNTWTLGAVLCYAFFVLFAAGEMIWH